MSESPPQDDQSTMGLGLQGLPFLSMGVVYKAHETDLDRVVAIKMVLPGVMEPDDLRRFQGEASAAARLSHPNIVKVHRVGVHQDRPFYSMDYIEGRSLADRLRDGPLPGKTAAHYVALVARAIQHAHEQGTLHRDLKPANILVDRNDVPHVTDFGLAKHLSADTGHTATGVILGTPGSMAPEQAAGKKDLTPACDVYGLGALLYELLVARPPFCGETRVDTVIQVLENDPAPPRLLNPRIDKDVETVCLKCLRKESAQRYASARDLADDLERYTAGEPISARSVNVLDYVTRSLESSQHVQEMGPYGNMCLWIALVALAGGAVKQWMVLTQQPVALIVAAQLGEFALVTLVQWRALPGGLFPRTTAERHLWSLLVGYLLACGVVGVAARVTTRMESVRDGTEYLYYAALTGLMFFALGSNYWGRCYLFGLAFFALALALLLDVRWGALAVGVLIAVVLLLVGRHLRRLGTRAG